MKLELVRYRCADCTTVFEAPALADSAYGEFLLWSKNGKVVYLNAFLDSTYKHLDNMLSVHPKTVGLQPLERAKILRRIYGKLTCDFDDVDSPFEMDKYPPCVRCHSQNMAFWERKRLPEIVDVLVPSVTHHRWSMLQDSEKLSLLDAALGSLK